jgi:branched-chain amino acid transport system ATP-binding protein
MAKSVPILSVDNIHAYYGDSHILQGISIDVPRGKVVGLLGRNGVGKTTTIHTTIGLLHPRSGEILLKGESISKLPTYEIMRRRVGWVPQGRRIFPTLTAGENLALAAAKSQPGPWSLDRMFQEFPILAKRQRTGGDKLSGGEQQMLAIARALIQNPDLILMDEPSEGLAPLIRGEIAEIIRQLNAEGCAILLVEQNLAFALRIAQDVLVMNKGRIVFRGTARELSADINTLRQFLGVTGKTAG